MARFWQVAGFDLVVSAAVLAIFLVVLYFILQAVGFVAQAAAGKGKQP